MFKTKIKFRGKKTNIQVFEDNDRIPEGAFFSNNNGQTWHESGCAGDLVSEHKVFIKRVYMKPIPF